MNAGREEQLRLVVDFSELRAGIVLVIKPCHWCGEARHRGVVVEFVNARPVLIDRGQVERDSGWAVRPPPSCTSLPFVVTRDAIAEGIVFRVLDGLEDPAEYAAELEAVELLARAGVRPATKRAPATSGVPFLPERRR